MVKNRNVLDSNYILQLRHIIRTLGPVGTVNRIGTSWTILANCIAGRAISNDSAATVRLAVTDIWKTLAYRPTLPELDSIEHGDKHQPTLPGRQTAPNLMVKRVHRIMQERGVYAACRALGVSWTVLLSVASNSDASTPHLYRISDALETIWPTIASKEPAGRVFKYEPTEDKE